MVQHGVKYISTKKIKENFNTIFLSILLSKTKGNVVPPKFVAFLQASLSKMAGHHYISPDLIDMEFWTEMPLKFRAIKFYDKSLVSEVKYWQN